MCKWFRWANLRLSLEFSWVTSTYSSCWNKKSLFLKIIPRIISLPATIYVERSVTKSSTKSCPKLKIPTSLGSTCSGFKILEAIGLFWGKYFKLPKSMSSLWRSSRPERYKWGIWGKIFHSHQKNLKEVFWFF